MTTLRTVKNRITAFVGAYENYLLPAFRFVFALVVFLLIRGNLGYSNMAGKLPLLLGLAVICGILPFQVTIFASAALITLNLYALSMACALVFLLIFIVIYLLYFRFSPKNSLGFLLTPAAFCLHVPYAMPVATGLIGGPYSFVSVLCGTVMYYLLAGIRSHASEIIEMESDAEIGLTSKLNVALGQVIGNKEMYLVIIIFIVTAAVVYMIRRANIDNAWLLAIIAGILIQTLGLFAGYMVLRINGKILWLMLGAMISMILCFVIQFIFMDLDYSRVEYVQFEDDEYYYYVKAVPKNSAMTEQKKKISFGSGK